MNLEINEDGKFYYDSDEEYHREDGPAYEGASGNKYYYLENIPYEEEDYWKKIKELNKCKLFKLEDKKIGWI